MTLTGVVVIGRNEGDRLRRSLESVRSQTDRIVYVDSGSTDGSVTLARSLGADVVELDMSKPFTMARGRNAGFYRLLDLYPDVQFVQFLDGDCEMVSGWLQRGQDEMRDKTHAAVVSGRRREYEPQRSIYHRLVDMEWDTPHRRSQRLSR